MADHRLLDDLAAALLDGSPVDWPAAEARAGAAGQSLIRDLKLLASVAGVHKDVMPEPSLERWGHLRLFERVGRGSSGDVIRAWDTQLDREVALKLLPARSAAAGGREPASAFTMILGEAQSIIREARLLAKVQHPNVVTIHGAAQIGDRVGLWMEFIHGYTLEQLLQQNGPFREIEVIAIGIELCRAVSAVHEAWLLHRDIKAHNVMRASDGRIVLMDFGTGRELDGRVTAEVAGTPLYLAPELMRLESATVQSDVYSLGVLLFRLTSGAYPVGGETIAALRAAHERGERTSLRAAAPAATGRLARIVEQAIDPKPERRFQTAAALGAALLKLQRHERRKPMLYAAGVLAALAGAGIGVWALRPTTPAAANASAPIVVRLPAPLSGPVRPQGIRRSVEVRPLTNAAAQPGQAWLSVTLAELLRREIRATEYFRWLPDEITLAKPHLGEVLWNAQRTAYDDLSDLPEVRFVPPMRSADFIVAGDYRTSGSPEELHVTVTVGNPAGKRPLRTVTETGSVSRLTELMSRIGAGLRDALGAPPLTDDQMRALVNSRPANAAAARAYAEGLAKAPHDAVELMQQAIAADPRFAPAFAILAEGWVLRREIDHARAAAAKAAELSAGLTFEERALIAIRTASVPAHRVSPGASLDSLEPRVRQLFSYFPDTRVYGYAAARLVLGTQSRSGGPASALLLLDETKRLPGAVHDADLLMLEATASRRSTDLSRAQRTLDSAARLAEARHDQGLLGVVRYEEARLAKRQREPARALSLAEDALQHFVAGKHRAQVLAVRSAIGAIVASEATFSWVKPGYESLIAGAAKRQDAARELALRRSLAHALSEHGALSAARSAWEALEQRTATGEPADGLVASLELGQVLHRQGELAAARKKFEATLAAALSRQDMHVQKWARLLLAQALLDMGELAKAREQIDRSVDAARGDEPLRIGLSPALSISALIKLAEGDAASAKELLAEATSIPTFVWRQHCTVELVIAGPIVTLETGPVDRALAEATGTARCARDTLRPDAKAAADMVTTLAWLRARKVDDARRAFAPVESQLKTTEDRLLRLSAGIVAARLQAASKAPADVTAATRALNGLVRDATILGAVAIAFEARLALGDVEFKIGDVQAGRAHLTSLERDATAKGFLNVARKVATILSKP